MKLRKARKEVVKEFQNKVDEFFEKVAPYTKKVMTVLGVVAVGTSVVLLTGCNGDTEKEEVDFGAYVSDVHTLNNQTAEAEKNFEKQLATYLSAQTGQNIELIDMKDIKLVKSSGYYMVISGEFISGVKEGAKECSVTLQLTEEQYKNAEEFLKNGTTYNFHGSYGKMSVRDENTVALNYYPETFLKGMHNIINDDQTKVLAVYDKDNKEWVFDADEPVVSNKR